MVYVVKCKHLDSRPLCLLLIDDLFRCPTINNPQRRSNSNELYKFGD
jgi:hypothetical protein